MTYVGTEGNVWCSSSYYAGNHNAGYLFFRAGDVRPLNGTNRAYGFAVRCRQHLALIPIGRCRRVMGGRWRW
ncbi:MAG: hypothetical protein K1V82_05690, partial [Alistipes sp.]